jgi:hypothetical protein
MEQSFENTIHWHARGLVQLYVQRPHEGILYTNQYEELEGSKAIMVHTNKDQSSIRVG